MANVELRLKVSKSAYEDKIAKLEGYITLLDGKITDYERKKTELDSFMDGTDDNYESLKQAVQENINRVRKAKEMCENSMQMLRDTLQDMDDFGENLKKNIEEGIEAAKNLSEGGFNAMNLLD